MSRLYCLFIILLGSNLAFSQGIDFYEGDWKDALKEAKSEDKLVFIDAYAKWCGPCKMMSKKVFTDPTVGDYFNQEFISIKIDMEEAPGIEFGAKYPVRAYPTLIFLDGDGNIVLKKTGARQAEGLINLGKEAIIKFDRSEDYAVKYKDGERDVEFMIKYVRELNKVGKSSLKIANDYIRSEPEITDKQFALFVMEAATEADSRIFTLFMEHRKLAEAQSSEKEVQDRIWKACWNTVLKGIEYESKFLIDEAKAKMKKYNKDQADAFNYEADMHFAKAYQQEEAYLDAGKNYAKKIIKKDAQALTDLAIQMQNAFPESENVLEEVLKICERVVDMEDENTEYRMNLIRVLIAASKTEEALKMAQETIELIRSKGESTRNIEAVIKFIESELEKT